MSKAKATRLSILQKAFELVYKAGYQATSIDDIIAKTQVTKGAFFYHFKSKDDMGLAMINEVLYPGMQQALIQPLTAGANPVRELYLMMKNLLLANPSFKVKYGCPAINLVEEMAPQNEAFNKALLKLAVNWQGAIEVCLQKGKTAGKIRRDVNVKQAAVFIISGYAGIRNMGKLYGNTCYPVFLKEFKTYLTSLK